MDNNVEGNTQEEQSKISRREALAKLGKFTAYSAPVVIGLVSSARSFAHPAGAAYVDKMDCDNAHLTIIPNTGGGGKGDQGEMDRMDHCMNTNVVDGHQHNP